MIVHHIHAALDRVVDVVVGHDDACGKIEVLVLVLEADDPQVAVDTTDINPEMMGEGGQVVCCSIFLPYREFEDKDTVSKYIKRAKKNLSSMISSWDESVISEHIHVLRNSIGRWGTVAEEGVASIKALKNCYFIGSSLNCELSPILTSMYGAINLGKTFQW